MSRSASCSAPGRAAVREEVGLLAAAYGGGVQVVATRGLDRRDRRPAHAEVTLDRAGDRRGGDDLAGQAAVLGVELDDAVHVGGRTADVDDDDVTGAAVLVVEAAGEQLDAGQHDVGRRAAHHRVKVRPRASVRLLRCLPPMTWLRKISRIARARAVRGEHADPRHDVVGEDVRRPRPGEQLRDQGLRLDVAGDHDRSRPRLRRPGTRASPSSTSALPPSVPPTSSTTSGSADRSAASLVVVEPAVTAPPRPCRRWRARPGGRPRR